jgi:hypothetical protein
MSDFREKHPIKTFALQVILTISTRSDLHFTHIAVLGLANGFRAYERSQGVEMQNKHEITPEKKTVSDDAEYISENYVYGVIIRRTRVYPKVSGLSR